MLFQTLDDKSECVGIYCANELVFDLDEFPEDLSKTWKYSSYLSDYKNIEYANLYIGDKKIHEVIPEYLKEDWEDVAGRLLAFERSLKLAKVDRSDNCIYDLTPSRFLVEFCEVKNEITKHVLGNYPRPKRYEYLLKVCQMLEGISGTRLNINRKHLQAHLGSKKTHSIVKRLLETPPYIKYNQFGTKTGRLTTRPNSFPILTLKKSLRTAIEPVNDYFVELDFNGAEVRVLMGLLGMEQPQKDIHQHHIDAVFQGSTTRESAKTAFFAWLYGSRTATSSNEGEALKKFYDKQKILNDYWDGGKICTPFKKEIDDVDRHHALNYIVQSTTAELTILQAMKIDYLLRSSAAKSRLCCIIHDAIVIDFSKEDEYLLPTIKSLMSSTKFGDFKININSGNNLGNLRELPV
jgi:hypothetical protein